MERKSIPLELKDLDTSKRTAVIAHATYDSIDRVDDIARKGMFTKSWNESKSDIALYLNHNDTLSPGKVLDVFEDYKHAYTKAFFGTHTLGNDTLIMLDEGVIKWASFGYNAIKASPLKINGRTVRELKEAKHIETSPLTKLPAHPDSKIISVTKSLIPECKSLSQSEFNALKRLATLDMDALQTMVQLSADMDTTSDLYNWILWQISRRADLMGSIRSQLQYNAGELKALTDHVEVMEKFVNNTSASDACIKSVQSDIEEAKAIISKYDTAGTHDGAPPVSRKDDSMYKQLLTIQTLLATA